MDDTTQTTTRDYKLETLALHAGYDPQDGGGARAVPISYTTAFQFRDAKHAAALFALQESGPIYTRIGNPTNDALERRLAAMEGGVASLAVASGHAAEVIALLTLLGAGDELVSSRSLYGGTFHLFKETFARLGIRVRFADASRPEDVAAAITPRCRGVYVESIGNPRLDVPHFAALAAVAHDAGVPLVVDNTCATPALLRPIEHGADVVIESATKYIGGHGQAMGGAVVDGGTFPWDNGLFPALSEPNAGYDGVRLTEAFGPAAFIARARLELLRDLGPALSPFNASSFLTGLETLALRMERHSDNALAVGRYLCEHPQVAWVRYPGLPDDPSHANARRYLPDGCGGLLAFGLRGGYEAGRRFIDNVSLFSLVANIGDTRTLVIHPASTTHQQLSPEDRLEAGVGDDLIRLSVGIEHIDDIRNELERTLALV